MKVMTDGEFREAAGFAGISTEGQVLLWTRAAAGNLDGVSSVKRKQPQQLAEFQDMAPRIQSGVARPLREMLAEYGLNLEGWEEVSSSA